MRETIKSNRDKSKGFMRLKTFRRIIFYTQAFFVFSLLTLIPSSARTQDCSNPDGIKGDVLFNSTHDTFQGCTGRGWMGFHESASPAPDPCTISGTPGTACADGQTVYAGTWNGSRYYTTMTDQSTSARYGTDMVTLGVNARSDTNGLTNTNTALASIEANPQVGSCNTTPYNPPACTNAHVLCKGLRATLGGDWYLPAYDEIVNVLYANKVAIGGFSNNYYWSSTESNNSTASIASLSSGNVSYTNKGRWSYAVREARVGKRNVSWRWPVTKTMASIPSLVSRVFGCWMCPGRAGRTGPRALTAR